MTTANQTEARTIDITPTWAEWGRMYAAFAESGERKACAALRSELIRALSALDDYQRDSKARAAMTPEHVLATKYDTFGQALDAFCAALGDDASPFEIANQLLQYGAPAQAFRVDGECWTVYIACHTVTGKWQLSDSPIPGVLLGYPPIKARHK